MTLISKLYMVYEDLRPFDLSTTSQHSSETHNLRCSGRRQKIEVKIGPALKTLARLESADKRE